MSPLLDLPSSKPSINWVPNVINLAKIFDFAIVAEGIEDDVQAATLAKMGCHVGQGYFTQD